MVVPPVPDAHPNLLVFASPVMDLPQGCVITTQAVGGGAGGGRSLNDLPMPGMGGMPNFSSMMDAAAPGGPGMGGFGGIPPVADPEQAFAQQLTQLEVCALATRWPETMHGKEKKMLEQAVCLAACAA